MKEVTLQVPDGKAVEWKRFAAMKMDERRAFLRK